MIDIRVVMNIESQAGIPGTVKAEFFVKEIMGEGALQGITDRKLGIVYVFLRGTWLSSKTSEHGWPELLMRALDHEIVHAVEPDPADELEGTAMKFLEAGTWARQEGSSTTGSYGELS